MLLVDVELRASPRHGFGVFSRAPIPRGAPVWQFDPEYDLAVDEQTLAGLAERVRELFRHYGYWEGRLEKHVLCFDDARFINHDDDPNTDGCRAVRDIAAGEEITCSYNRRYLEFRGPRRLPSAAIPRMVSLLHDPDIHLRRYAAKSLATAGVEAERAASELVGALSDADELTRYFALKALSRLDPVPAGAEADLARFAREQGGRLRYYSVKACGRLRNPGNGTLQALQSALDDPESDVRAAAKRALERIASRGSRRS